ncbi:restriction endonuclease subunit S, partial [Patescibacteria group bacterium]|nr:restriction endonuclease subunit S [Patescibacteria group bacterium]
ARHKKNCLTITARGTIGRSNKRHTDFDAIGRLLILDPKVKLDGFFISEYLNNKITFSIESTGVPQLTAPQASQYLLVFPEPTEQTAIATVLSDSDVLIENLEKLIAKKRAIKQGAMQQLLTGKKRLPGFSGEWVVKKLGEFGFDISDGNYSSKYPKASEFKERGVPFIRANNIKGLKVVDDDMRFISNQLHSELTKGHLKKDDILITTRGEIGQIAIVPNRHIGSNINAQVVRINAGEKFNKYYFAYFLLKSDTQESLLNMQTGSALKQLPVGKLKELKIVYPPLPEQTAIATVLSDMDAEIEKLEKKLNKYHQIKTGMMQQLLTGNIRLVKI